MTDTPTVDELFPLPPGYAPPTPRVGRPPTYASMWDRLMTNTEVGEGPNACWTWTGATRRGYPSLNVRENGRHRTISAHREVLLQLGQPIPDNHEPDHLCYNTMCIRPCHLEVVTKQQNLARRRY